eukprot:TRINITY_DN136691_c0_g1_i1.p2 TRINITY_DN136691_c0_g1~~TRINITY_DN136691_c0_g1_i1.p2  ORF type:complete len:220 (-),score=14.20 TRINITY_DN136691_c0_g1_i1:990-1649(-)
MAAELRRKKKADFFQEKRLKQIPPEVIITPVTILRDKALANFNPIFASPTSSKVKSILSKFLQSDKIKAASDALDKPIDSPELLGHLAEFLRVCVSGNDADLLVGILVDVGLIPKLVALLEVPLVKVQFEASWALINISHSKYGEVVRKAGAHVKLSDLLDLSKLDICENVLTIKKKNRQYGHWGIWQETAKKAETKCLKQEHQEKLQTLCRKVVQEYR